MQILDILPDIQRLILSFWRVMYFILLAVIFQLEMLRTHDEIMQANDI